MRLVTSVLRRLTKRPGPVVVDPGRLRGAVARTGGLPRRLPDRVLAAGAIDVVTGDVVLHQVDVRSPLVVERTHVSSYREGRLFGVSWASTLDQRIEVDAAGVCFAAADGSVVVYPTGDRVQPLTGPRLPLTVDATGQHTISDPVTGRTLHFAGGGPGTYPITGIGERNGDRVDFVYEDAVLVEIRHSGGPVVGVGTDEAGRVVELRPVFGKTVHYRYDDAGHLAEVVDLSGRASRFCYDARGRVTDWTDGAGHSRDYTYDEDGRGIQGHDTLVDYVDDDFTVVVDVLGDSTTYRFNRLGQVVSETDPLGHRTRSLWDPYGRLVSRTDPFGRTTAYTYDDAGRLTGVRRPDRRRLTARFGEVGPVEVTDADGGVWRQRFDDRGNRLTLTDPLGRTTVYSGDDGPGEYAPGGDGVQWYRAGRVCLDRWAGIDAAEAPPDAASG